MRQAPRVGVPAHVPLVHLVRNGLVEGVHHGSVVVLAPDRSILFQAGDIDTAFYPRSTVKPIQAVAMTRLGLALSPDLLALTTSSHSGEEHHITGTHTILNEGGFTEDDLANPTDLPYDPIERTNWIAAGRPPSKIAHNCSGKHASMLHTVRKHGWSTRDYLEPEHPLQREIAATVEDLTGQRIAHVATDGCGSPLFSVSLRGLATAAGRIASAPEGTAENLVAQAIRSHPEMVAGTRRDVTKLMTSVPGLIAKDGFEAVQIAALPDGTAIAAKIADGFDRARLPVILAALSRAGVELNLLATFCAEGITVAGELAGGSECGVGRDLV
jgi:L-asparaginase II